MRETGVRHLVGSLHEIDDVLLRTLDSEAAAGTVWRGGGADTGDAGDVYRGLAGAGV